MSRWLPLAQQKGIGKGAGGIAIVFYRVWKVWGGREAVQNEEPRVRRDLLTHSVYVHLQRGSPQRVYAESIPCSPPPNI